MKKISFCDEVQRYIKSVGSTDQLALSDAAVEHVAGCNACKGAIVMLAATTVGIPADAGSCESCLENMPAYIEAEEAPLPYLGVWWHLWFCKDCNEVLRLTKVLLKAEEGGDISPPQIRR